MNIVKRKLPHAISWCLGLALAGAATGALGNGYALPDQDAEATARGEAFVATADNPSAVYYNPAGITQLEGHNVRVGVFSPWLKTTYTAPSGQSFTTKDAFHAVPQAYYTYTAESLPLSVGLGLFSPYGLGLEWPQTTGFRTLALKSELSYLSLSPVVAYRILTNLSVGIGPTFNYSQIELRQGVTPFPYNDVSTLKGDGTAYGFNAGVMWQPHPKLSLGVTYHSKTEVDYDGHTELSFQVPPPGFPNYLKMDASASVPFPQSVISGISYRPTTNWNVEFNLGWTDWQQVKTIQVRQLIPAALVLNWESSFYYAFGVTRQLGRGWHASAGYIFNENSAPDRTYSPLVSDLDRHFITGGVGYQGEHLSFDVAYQFGYGPGHTVTGSAVSAGGQSADGRYEYLSHSLEVALGWHF